MLEIRFLIGGYICSEKGCAGLGFLFSSFCGDFWGCWLFCMVCSDLR